MPDIQVMIVLGDAADDRFMDVNLGMSASGGTPGYLWLNFWPSGENLARVDAVAAHELNHNRRYANRRWDPVTVTVGEQVVSEGLGGTPVGLPTGAGYAVGNRLVDDYLTATGQTAAHALLVEAADVIGMSGSVG